MEPSLEAKRERVHQTHSLARHRSTAPMVADRAVPVGLMLVRVQTAVQAALAAALALRTLVVAAARAISVISETLVTDRCIHTQLAALGVRVL